MSDPTSSESGEEVTAPAPPGWRRSPGRDAAVTVALLLAAAGLALGRIDIALLSLPLILALAVARELAPDADADASGRVTLEEIPGQRVRYRIDFELPSGVAMIVARYRVLGGRPHELVTARPRPGALGGTVALLHSGPQELVRLDYRLLSADGLVVSDRQLPLTGDMVVSPSRREIEALPMPRRLAGTIGSHDAPRAGQGGEFRDVHPFSAGDRLRRIDWKTTARRSHDARELYVRRTNTLADAVVLIVMDSRDDVGEQIAEWSGNSALRKGLSSLDIAREAASSIASAYITAGDRVGLQDLSSRSRMIGHSGGKRHLWRLQRAIEVTAPVDVSTRRLRAPLVPPGALIFLLSTLLDDHSVTLALNWMGNGHRVIAVDVLAPARFDRSTHAERLAHRMVMMERDDRMRVMRSHGIELLTWQDVDASLPVATRLAALSRPRRRLGAAEVRR